MLKVTWEEEHGQIVFTDLNTLQSFFTVTTIKWVKQSMQNRKFHSHDQNMQMVQPPDLKQEPEESNWGHRILGSEKVLNFFFPLPDIFYTSWLCECECTVSSIEHAGAALSSAHAPDRWGQVHSRPSVLGSGSSHIWRNTVFWRRRGGKLASWRKTTVNHHCCTVEVLILELFIREVYRCVCVPAHQPIQKQQAEAEAVVGSWALHGRGWRKQMRRWRSFGRNGWSSNRDSAGSGPALRWEQPFCAVSPRPLMQKTCLRWRERKKNT